MTSCWVRFSISWISGTEKRALARISSASAEGMSPREAIASQARTSISSQKENFLSSSHISRISGREYLSITPRDYGTKAGSKAFFAECIPASRKGAYALDVAVIKKDPAPRLPKMQVSFGQRGSVL